MSISYRCIRVSVLFWCCREPYNRHRPHRSWAQFTEMFMVDGKTKANSNLEHDWHKFRKIRNAVVKLIRESKQSYYDKLKDKLASGSLSAKDWWSTLKFFILPSSKTSIPPLEYNDNIYTDELDKANILNNFFSKSNYSGWNKCHSSWYTTCPVWTFK